jgi:hypothetical protein
VYRRRPDLDHDDEYDDNPSPDHDDDAVGALTLSSTCTPWWHWPEDRAWRINNPNGVAVDLTLEAVYAGHGYDNPIADSAPPGYSTWYLPASAYGWNYATLDAAGDSTSAWNGNNTC